MACEQQPNHVEKKKHLKLYHTQHTKIILKWTIDVTVKVKTKKYRRKEEQNFAALEVTKDI